MTTTRSGRHSKPSADRYPTTIIPTAAPASDIRSRQITSSSKSRRTKKSSSAKYRRRRTSQLITSNSTTTHDGAVEGVASEAPAVAKGKATIQVKPVEGQRRSRASSISEGSTLADSDSEDDVTIEPTPAPKHPSLLSTLPVSNHTEVPLSPSTAVTLIPSQVDEAFLAALVLTEGINLLFHPFASVLLTNVLDNFIVRQLQALLEQGVNWDLWAWLLQLDPTPSVPLGVLLATNGSTVVNYLDVLAMGHPAGLCVYSQLAEMPGPGPLRAEVFWSADHTLVLDEEQQTPFSIDLDQPAAARAPRLVEDMDEALEVLARREGKSMFRNDKMDDEWTRLVEEALTGIEMV
jgi:hypothetical protein